MSARADYPKRCSYMTGYPATEWCVLAEGHGPNGHVMRDVTDLEFNSEWQANALRAEIVALRARVVVAEEALRVAHEHADRLARSVRNASWGYNASRCAWGFFITGEQRATDLDAHAAAVSSRPKAPQ